MPRTQKNNNTLIQKPVLNRTKLNTNFLLGLQRFTENDIQNKKDFSDELICGICQDVLQMPKKCKSCRKDFCSHCINTQLKYQNRCPQRCHQNGGWEIVKSSLKITKQLQKLKVQCKEPNCYKIITIGDYLKHYTSECQEVFTYCPSLGCTSIQRKKNLNDHLLVCDMKQKQYKYRSCKKITKQEENRLLQEIQILTEKKEYKQALKISYQYGLQMQETYGKYFPYLPKLIYQIGVLHFHRNDFQPALNHLLKFEEISESKIDSRYQKDIQNHFTDVLFTIGYLYEELSQYQKASNYYERSLKQDISYNYNEDMSVLINLGHAYRLIGNYQKSIGFCTWAIKIYNCNHQVQQYIESKHMDEDYWKVYHNLTYAQYKYGNIKEAAESYKTLEQVSHKIHGIHGNQYYETLLLQSQILFEIGEQTQAITLIKKTIKKRKQLLDHGHNDIIYSQRKLTQFYTNLKQYKQAEKVLKDCLIDYKHYKDDKPNQWKYRLLLYQLSKIYFAQYKYDQALEIAEDTFQTLLDDKEVSSIHSRIHQFLGLIYQKCKQSFKAIDYFFKAKSQIIYSYGVYSYKHAKILDYISQFYFEIGNQHLALDYINQGLEITQQLFLQNHPFLAKLFLQKANILLSLNFRDEQKLSLKNCYQILQNTSCTEQLNQKNMNIQCLTQMAELELNSNNNVNQSIKIYKDLLAYMKQNQQQDNDKQQKEIQNIIQTLQNNKSKQTKKQENIQSKNNSRHSSQQKKLISRKQMSRT